MKIVRVISPKSGFILKKRMTVKEIKSDIKDELESLRMSAFPKDVAAVYHCYRVTASGHECDLVDAINAAFPTSEDDDRD